MIRPYELSVRLPVHFDHGEHATTLDVWDMLAAAAAGDVMRVRSLVAESRFLACCKYNYTPPIHLAVREGHQALVQFLIECGGYPPEYRSEPFGETLLEIARDRGHLEIDRLLQRAADDASIAARCVAPGDSGRIRYDENGPRSKLEALISGGELRTTREILTEQPMLMRDELFFWGEGILAVPANHADVDMLELLLELGARVPAISKWGDRYYFKHYYVAERLLRRGMDPNHRTWQGVTLLHLMAWSGDLRKAALLLDHGADIDLLEQEHQSSALGLAARQGQHDMVKFLLERGADPHGTGAPWATPLAWAASRHHDDIVSLLNRA